MPRITLKKDAGNVYKAFEHDEFIGYVTLQEDNTWLYNPHHEESLKSRSFGSWAELNEYLNYRNY